ncbi:NAD-dependent epimerase/dehydratase family protein [Flavobacterium sp. LS1P28]|uniref:NAD-dependent epimerase/dehydratase family protein n=1 Tax=Flavobacterium sp. LS1P28 TaxID=2497752 RepID=UPI000F81A197|nr:NAD-dependent epimerase/dehydratase [Flavobacterium sp. LS1P28]RTY83457.1 NAD-dependent epimerase/dehydratase family protein [Flavobacterium sp. LS1P28]
MQNKILLTGATGFLGSHLLKRLIEAGADVLILVRETSNKERIKNLEGFSIFTINKQLSNIDALFEMYSIDTIIHVATEYGRDLPYSSVLESNVLLPIKLIESADKKKLNLFVNTDSFFSKFQDYSYLKEYIMSKNIFTDYLKSLSGIQVFNLQLEHIYGEFDSKTKFITSVMGKILVNEKSIKLTEGSQKRDFIYVLDVVDAYLVVLANKQVLGQYTEFEVGTGSSISVKDFVSKIHQIMDSKSDLLFGALVGRINEIKDSKANNLNLCKLGWKPKFTYETAIKRIVSLEK